MATKEVGLVIMGSSSATSVGEFALVIATKPVAVAAENVVGIETDPLVDSSWRGDMVGADAALSVTIKSPVKKGRR